MARILVAGADPAELAASLRAAGHEVIEFSDAVQARSHATSGDTLMMDALAGQAEFWTVQGQTEYAVFFMDPQGMVRSWNPGAAKTFGYLASDIVGQSAACLFTDQDRKAGVPEKELELAESEGLADNTRWMRRGDGTQFWAEGLATPVRNAAGALIGFGKVARDASERRRLEQALERSNDELQRFAYTVSHDLQEPIRTIKSYAELLARRYGEQLEGDAIESLNFMIDGANRMSQLVRDLLTYSQAGREERTRPEPTQAASVLQWALMNLDRLVKETGAVITYDPLPTVYANQGQLAQVFQNLIGNAIKFRSGEPPRVHISAERVNDDMWQIAIRDNGIGVAPEFHERIFGVFKRLHGREVPGTGIGLAICRKIIEAHGGHIWIDSEPGKGATVKFTLRGDD